MSKALIAMSGGVDSAVAAALMCRAGYECIGVHMSLHRGDSSAMENDRSCGSPADSDDARAIAIALGMDYYDYDLSDHFHAKVVAPFIAAYLNGRTPNPCIECNRHMKFAELVKLAQQMGCEKIVTGHYVRVEQQGNRYVLKKGCNLGKDQSYVLYFMTQDMLAHTAFPLGSFQDKEQVRELAASLGFHNAAKPDSQDICFVPDGDYASFIDRETGILHPGGYFVDQDGVCLGRHKGIHHYTVGQRRGLGVSAKEPLYVCRKDTERNLVVLGSERDLYSSGLTADGFNWISGETPASPVRCTARTRYHAKEVSCTASVSADGLVRVVFDEPVRAITPGQSVVLYDEDIVLGGGIILR